MPALQWSDVARRLRPARHYWLHTTRLSGAPEVSPVWGVVVDEHLYCYTCRTTIKARNLGRDPRVVINLEDGGDVVIVHGRAVDLGRPTDHPDVIRAFAGKYDQPEEEPFLPSSDLGFDVLYRIEPSRALLWSLPDTEASTQRWTAP